ncbi:tRNA (adenosine(37)-N6)-threonylcarbamoyltransferase complex dimerization subunit type 1 TsaB [Gordonia sp. X0973]|uniref:tRNA (adenosine(37)-N6)-threonylcarbamoyltransferase complex dimerization subunit type 1 TsaB n=1 Tax=Gordonia sp. X0973 TaxID=2742602 RepID=UPI000F520AA6|nr:tRNA (adenosine(37)-N6)-threonylcarbamoyltransferase complex dimerization subunit type 1 TsaB [Gordonia sp. X0973]QKT06670.1 tRNA (adenosine(37)-N6)-threonylcarbamoyltransferase complex dimerization subunit type 1 TsaB [Gordonia sp. X0973]
MPDEGVVDRERRVLVIDTATSAVVTGLAVVSGDGTVAEAGSRIVADDRRHAETLTTLMRECLAETGWHGTDLDAVVVGCGPGPFTGLRVGMATAAAYGDALRIPVYGVCTLDALAGTVSRDVDARSLVVVTDARRREVYWARYVDGKRVDGPGVLAPAALAQQLADETTDLVAGVPSMLPEVGERIVDATPDVVGLAAVAAEDVLAAAVPEPLVPLYLRRPDAVELADQKKHAARKKRVAR